jgi:hypothetical protein
VTIGCKKGKDYELRSQHDVALFVGIPPSSFCKMAIDKYGELL